VEPKFGEVPGTPNIRRDTACRDKRNADEWVTESTVQNILRVILTEDDKTRECLAFVPEDLYYQTADQPTGLVADVWGECQVENLAYPSK
jgi:hypothetical protein